MSREMAKQTSISVPTLKLNDVTKIYKSRGRSTVALNHVTFSINPGKVVALVCESGSGKTTISRLVTGIERPTSGEVTFGDWQVESLRARQLREFRSHVQMIFQDPFSSLNPHNTVLQTIIRPLMNHRRFSLRQATEMAIEIMSTVRLTPVEQFASKKPHQLSGGQRQRLVIARAIAPEPELVVADEPVSMLDVSIRADVLYLIDGLRKRTGMSVLYITHDLLSARVFADEVIVLYKGHVVECGQSDEVIRHPAHPYTQLLLNAIPNPRRLKDLTSNDETIGGNGFDKFTLAERGRFTQTSGQGCPFVKRCIMATAECDTIKPSLKGDSSHQVACIHVK